MKLIGLDVGDRWTGIALSDELHIIASPYETVDSDELEKKIAYLIDTQPISHIVVGYPITLRGTESDQTRKIRASKELWEKKFSTVEWVLWDERLTSKQAARLKQAKTKEQKLKQHSVAAALILKSYLDHLAFLRN